MNDFSWGKGDCENISSSKDLAAAVKFRRHLEFPGPQQHGIHNFRTCYRPLPRSAKVWHLDLLYFYTNCMQPGPCNFRRGTKKTCQIRAGLHGSFRWRCSYCKLRLLLWSSRKGTCCDVSLLLSAFSLVCMFSSSSFIFCYSYRNIMTVSLTVNKKFLSIIHLFRESNIY